MLAGLSRLGLGQRLRPTAAAASAAHRALVWAAAAHPGSLLPLKPAGQSAYRQAAGRSCWQRGSSSSSMSTSAAAGDASGAAAASEAVVVYVTVPSREVGQKIGHSLVEAKLAACVNIVPGLLSIYSWEGKVNEDQEELLIIKSRQALVPELTAAVKAQHPYDECEVVALPIVGGSPSYLRWVLDSTKTG